MPEQATNNPPFPPSAAHVTVTGDVDVATVDHWLDASRAALTTRPAALILHLAGVSFMDSAGLRMLLTIRAAAANAHCRFQLADVPGRVDELLLLSGLGGIFDMSPGGAKPAPAHDPIIDAE